MTAPGAGRPLRVAFAGAGMISFYHLTGWRQTPGAELVAICDPDLDKARARAREFEIPAVYADAATMLAHARPDAIEIASPVDTHAAIVRLAAGQGVHVSCQKPLTPTVAEAERLVADVGDRVRFMVHENFRFRPHYRQAKAWVDEGRIGKAVQARMTVRCSGLLRLDGQPPAMLVRQPFMRQLERLIVFEVLIHHLDVLRALVGDLTVTAARLDHLTHEVIGEDTAVVTMAGADGLTAVLDGCLAAPGYPPLPSDRLELVGTEGTLVFDHDRLWLAGRPDTLVQHDLQRNYQACFTGAIQDFVAGLTTGRPFWTDRLDNLRTLRLMESCYTAT